MDITILQTTTLNTTYQNQLHELIASSNSYEPFLDCNTPYFLAFSKQTPTVLIGFLSFIISEGINRTEVEITALVSPKFRRQGIFHALFQTAKKTILSMINPYSSIIAALPSFLINSSICKGFAYSEYLMKLEKKDGLRPFICEYINTRNFTAYESFFSDEEDEFLLYRKDADEPCAVCSLEYSESFTNLYGVYVDEDCRRQGIGTLLMHNLIQEYFAENDLPLILNVRSTNTGAVKLYKKCGFTVESHVDFYNID